MAGTLHIVRKAEDTKAFECIKAQAEEDLLSLLLLQEGVRARPSLGAKTFLLREDADMSQIPPDVHPIGYDETVQLLLDHDSVVVW
ncbi:MAG: hypothetical protein ACE5OR_07900 [bacterium]